MDTNNRNVIRWLNSPAGIKWSKSQHLPIPALLISLKNCEFRDEIPEVILLWHRS